MDKISIRYRRGKLGAVYDIHGFANNLDWFKHGCVVMEITYKTNKIEISDYYLPGIAGVWCKEELQLGEYI